MAKLVLFDNPETRTNLLPLTYTRPVAMLRVGLTTVFEKWARLFPDITVMTAEYLSVMFPLSLADGECALFVAAHLLPSMQLLEALDSLSDGEALCRDGKVIAFRGTLPGFRSASSGREFEGEADAINFLYDIFLLNGKALCSDIEAVTAGRSSMPIESTNTVIGNPELVFIEEGASVQGCFLNTTAGPIYIGRDAEVMEGSCLRGPLAVCDHAVVNMGSKIYKDTTIGPWCKVGGELNNVVMQEYSNKAHDGFLGNAVIGAWCNIGAGCVASNLKNDYTEIKLWNYNAHRFTRTGLQFCGLIMGDHSKAGINTMFNTATVLGVGVNVYGSGFQRNFLASFSEGSRAGFTDVPLDRFFEIASRVMARRGVELTEADRDIFRHVNEMAHNFKV